MKEINIYSSGKGADALKDAAKEELTRLAALVGATRPCGWILILQ